MGDDAPLSPESPTRSETSIKSNGSHASRAFEGPKIIKENNLTDHAERERLHQKKLVEEEIERVHRDHAVKILMEHGISASKARN